MRSRVQQQIYRVALILIVTTAILSVLPTIALADLAQPDTFTILSARAATDMLEDGDLLIAAHYEIAWDDEGDYPDDRCTQTFICRLMNTTETASLGTATLYSYYNRGYDQGIISLYFSAEDAPTYGEPYVIRLEGNPSYYADAPLMKRIVADSDYYDGTGAEDNDHWMGEWIVDVLLDIEHNWDAYEGLLVAGNSLNSLGELYVNAAIPGLPAMAPSIYPLEVTAPEFTPGTWDHNKTTEYHDQWDGTIVEDAFDGLGELFGDYQIGTNFFCVGIMLAIMIASFSMFTNARPGLLIGFIVPVLGVPLGLFMPALLAVITFVFVVYMANQLFLKRAG